LPLCIDDGTRSTSDESEGGGVLADIGGRTALMLSRVWRRMKTAKKFRFAPVKVNAERTW